MGESKKLRVGRFERGPPGCGTAATALMMSSSFGKGQRASKAATSQLGLGPSKCCREASRGADWAVVAL